MFTERKAGRRERRGLGKGRLEEKGTKSSQARVQLSERVLFSIPCDQEPPYLIFPPSTGPIGQRQPPSLSWLSGQVGGWGTGLRAYLEQDVLGGARGPECAFTGVPMSPFGEHHTRPSGALLFVFGLQIQQIRHSLLGGTPLKATYSALLL